jgi:hypothetical protein
MTPTDKKQYSICFNAVGSALSNGVRALSNMPTISLEFGENSIDRHRVLKEIDNICDVKELL